MTSGRFGAGPLRGISHLLRAVAAARLLTVLDALRVEGTTDDLVPDTREVLHTATAHEHDRVLLQVVTDTGDVRGDLDLAREADARDLAERGVRLLRGRGVDAGAHTASLGGALEGRRLRLVRLRLPALADQLLDRRHYVSVCWMNLWSTGTRHPGRPAWSRFVARRATTSQSLRPEPTPHPGVSPRPSAPQSARLPWRRDGAVERDHPMRPARPSPRGASTECMRESPTARARCPTLPGAGWASKRQAVRPVTAPPPPDGPKGPTDR